jgi:phenylalanyl-tRNA synthetase beta chain
MKVSLSWLNEFVDISCIEISDLCHRLTMTGLEIDGVETMEKVENTVVGKVLECGKHPDADKLSLCKVTDGTEEFQVVCGAPNVAAGLTIPFAKVGAVLPGGFKIKKAKIRGIESMGMICSDAELGLAEKSDGIMPLPAELALGTDINEVLGLGDTVLEVSITPNRADCLSVKGVAREVAALYGREMKTQSYAVTETDDAASSYSYVKVLDEEKCPFYLGRVIKNVKIGPSPLWLQNRLRAVGVRPISNVVDVTNYVMFEQGQPLHTFDLRMIRNGIIVRNAKNGEKLLTLDEKEREMKDFMLLITDEEKPLAVAGVMGGEHSGISSSTTDVFLECAYFKPESTRVTARKLGMQTDSSYRYERGIDFENTKKMVNYAAYLLQTLAGGSVCKGVLSNDYKTIETPVVEFTAEKVNSLLGTDIKEEEMIKMLASIGMKPEKTGLGWRVASPSWRVDIERWQDIAEEVARLHGYDNIEATVPLLPADSDTLMPLLKTKRLVQSRLSALGFSEAINYSFMSDKLLELFDDPKRFVFLKNPISEDMNALRTYVFPGVVSTIIYNISHGAKDAKIFEVSSTYIKTDDDIPAQEMSFAFGVCGGYWPLSWNTAPVSEPFFAVKGVLENILASFYTGTVEFVRSDKPFLHPGKSAEIILDGESVGFLGELHPDILEKLDFETPITVCEVCLEKILSKGLITPKYAKFSRLPGVSRDISVVVPKSVRSGDMIKLIKTESQLIDGVTLFDIYSGTGLSEDEFSLAFRIFFSHPDKTLTDEETNGVVRSVIEKLGSAFGARLR